MADRMTDERLAELKGRTRSYGLWSYEADELFAELDAVREELAEAKRERDFWKRHLQECTVAAGFEHKESRHAADCAVLVGYRLASAAAVIEGLVGLLGGIRDIFKFLPLDYFDCILGADTPAQCAQHIDAALASAAAWQGGEHGQ